MEYASWSHECDAVTVLDREPPRVFVRNGLPPFRERFTLAHELAHIELAWHVGTVNCQVDAATIGGEYSLATVAGTQEREANEFASRILAPDRWLAPLVKNQCFFGRSNMQSTLDTLALAEMSAQAGLIALSRHLLPGHAFITDQAFAVSRGTPWPGSAPLGEVEIEQYLERSVIVEEFTHQGRKVLWAQTSEFTEPAELAIPTQRNSDESRTPHQVLLACCSRAFGEESAATKAMSINGVVGGMTSDSDLDWHESAIISVVRQRIAEKVELRKVLDDYEFPLYLKMRAQTIVQKRSGPSR
ncbi:ImmA/IrrE family metallo-endopeptidase [Streptomyces xanthophaeus]